jgi:hypothetical protein
MSPSRWSGRADLLQSRKNGGKSEAARGLELKGWFAMRLFSALVCGALAACSSGGVTVPDAQVLYEVTPPPMGSASTTGGDPFTQRIESALGEGGTPVAGTTLAQPLPQAGTPIDDDRLNLMQWTLEQQRIDAAVAERELAEARSQLVVVQPGPLPNRVQGVNIALYAKQTTHPVGERRYDRGMGAQVTGLGNCGRFRDEDAAQRAFLAGGGPERDRYGIDPDGDGFACRWDPTPYRRLTF